MMEKRDTSAADSADRKARQLADAARSGDPAAMARAVPLLRDADPAHPEDVQCLFEFFRQYTGYADADIEEMLAGLEHLASSKALNADQQQELAANFVALLDRAVELTRPDVVVAVGLAARRSVALDSAGSQAVFSAVVDHGLAMSSILQTLPEALDAEAATASDRLPLDRLREMVFSAGHFCLPLESLRAVGQEKVRDWLTLFSTPDEVHRHLGATGHYVRGRLLALDGQLDTALDAFLQAVDERPEPLFLYYATHVLQLMGRWQDAEQLLKRCSADCPEIQCLRLRLLMRRRKTCTEDEAIAGTEGRGSQAGAGLVGAKYALFSGQAIPRLPLEAGARRSHAEEWLRIQLSSAICAKDASRAKNLMGILAFRLFPAVERTLFGGMLDWIRGDQDQAQRQLGEVAADLPESTAALKVLAELQVAAGNPDEAAATLEEVVRNDPHDGRSRLRLVLFTCRCRPNDARERAEQFWADPHVSEHDLVLLGRGFLREAFRRLDPAAGREPRRGEVPADSGREIRGIVEEFSELATTTFDRCSQSASARAYAWLCQLVTAPPSTRASQAAELVAGRPDVDPQTMPFEARWASALLHLFVDDFPTALEGVEDLVEMCCRRGEPEIDKVATSALWRTARLARTGPEFARLHHCAHRYVAGRTAAALQLRPLLRALAWRSADPDDEPEAADGLLDQAGFGDDERRLARIIRSLARGAVDEAISQIDSQPLIEEKMEPWFQLAKGVVFLQQGDMQALAEIKERAANSATAHQWALLEAVAAVRSQSPGAADMLCGLMRQRQTSADCADSPLPLSGVLAHLALVGCKTAKQLVANRLTCLEARDLARDPDAAPAYLAGCVAMGQGQRAVQVLEGIPERARPLQEDLEQVHRHHAALAARRQDYRAACKELSRFTIEVGS